MITAIVAGDEKVIEWKSEMRFFKRVETLALAMPERSFLREMAPRIEEGLKAAVGEALHR